MRSAKPILAAALWGVFTQVAAQEFDGLYYPNFSDDVQWACTEDYVGSDGGALSIEGGNVRGVETFCILTDQQKLGVSGVSTFAASCTSEGYNYTSSFFMAKYGVGVLIADDNGFHDWRSCEYRSGLIDPDLFVSENGFLGRLLDFTSIASEQLVQLYWYSRAVCRGSVETWQPKVSDNACALWHRIHEALITKGLEFDTGEQEWRSSD